MAVTSHDSGPRAALGYPLFILAVVVLAIAGYVGYELYPRFDLSAASGIGLLSLAAAAGIASFFSPCSFSLLATLLAREASGGEGPRSVATRRALRFAGALALGATLFLLLVGVVIALGGSALFGGVTFTSVAGRTIRTVVGFGLIGLGLVQLGVLSLPFGGVAHGVMPLVRAQARLRRQRPTLGFGLYGFAYVLAGFG